MLQFIILFIECNSMVKGVRQKINSKEYEKVNVSCFPGCKVNNVCSSLKEEKN